MFKKAKRKSVKIKLAVTGPSGSGKTYSALKLARGLGEKIAVIDTENGSASLYSDQFEFDVSELHPPFSTEKYIEAIEMAEKCEYDVLIIDSISHEWSTLLDQKTYADSKGGNSFTNWAAFTPRHNKFLSAFLNSKLHIICCIRSKQEYILASNDRGKQVPQKIGLQPIQREGIEFEFTTVFDISMNHEASVSKDRTNIFKDDVFKITEETGQKIKEWLESAPEKIFEFDTLKFLQNIDECMTIEQLKKVLEDNWPEISKRYDKDRLVEHYNCAKKALQDKGEVKNMEF